MGAAYIYCRQSDPYGGAKNEGDDALSLDAQIAACRAHAAKLGHAVVGEYTEQFTGLSDQRPQYLKMLADLKANAKAHKKGDPGRVVALIIYKWSRLSRDPATVVYLSNQFRKQGVVIEPVADHQVGGSQYDELLVYTIATFNRIQVQDSIEFANNARKTLLDGGKLVCNGRARYGYKYDKEARTRVVDEEQAKVVRRIFDWFLDGHSAHKVMLLLQQEGIPSPSGRPRWGLKSIRDLVKDPSYKGAPMRVQKTERVPLDEGGGYHPCGSRKFRNANGREVGPPTPAIVSEAVWDKANELAKGRHRPLVRHDDWLVGRVWCASCGIRLTKSTHNSRGYSYWRCPNHRLYKECKIKLGHALDRHIRDEAEKGMIRFLGDPRVREAKLQTMQDTLADPSWQEEHDRNRDEIERLREKARQILRRFGDDPGLADLLEGEVRAIQAQIKAREELESSLAVKASQSRIAAETANQVRDWLLSWSTHWLTRNPTGSQPQQLLFQEYVEEGDKRLAAEAAGLRVEIGRPEDSGSGTIVVDVKVFDYEARSTYPKPPEEERNQWDWDEERDGPPAKGSAAQRQPSRGRNRGRRANLSGLRGSSPGRTGRAG